jgi:DNA ligase (NAD+)
MDKIERIRSLVQQTNKARDEYYNQNNPSLTDAEYDALFDELSVLERDTNYILSSSPTQTVGYKVVSKLQKRIHPTPLKSLNKTKSIDELNKWKNNKDIILMLKADGLTVELVYENGILTGAYTRGNGEIGEDITHNALTFKNLPKRIVFEGKLRIVGEAIIHKNDFDEINSKLIKEEKYATPRNLVSGSVRQLDSKICSERKVYFYSFNILEAIDTETSVSVLNDSKFFNFNWLYELGFEIIPTQIIKEEYKNYSMDRYIEALQKQAEKMFMPIDGIVASFDSILYSNSCSETSHHPTHSIAYKFEDEMEETILRDVEWNTTRSGQVNPTAIFDTVILDGTEVSRASLFNLTFIKDMKLNLLNRIKVSKRNLIIPYIEENLDEQEGNYLPIPEKCPSCGEKTQIRNTGTADFLFCTNINCPAQLLDKFVHFVSRNAMNIEGLSEATLEKFINAGFIKEFVDIYKLQQYENEIKNMEGLGQKSYTKLIEAIEKSKVVKFENFVYSLGISQIGTGGAKRLAKYFNNDIQEFLEATGSYSNFIHIEDFGDITACAVHEYFQNEDNIKQVKKLLQYITIKQEQKEVVTSNNFFGGKKVYCTGTFISYKKEELKNILEGLGAEFASGYAKSLDYLIVGSIKGSSKEDKAKKDDVSILTEEEFLNKIK